MPQSKCTEEDKRVRLWFMLVFFCHVSVHLFTAKCNTWMWKHVGFLWEGNSLLKRNMFPNISNSFPINKPQTFMKGLDLVSHSGFLFSEWIINWNVQSYLFWIKAMTWEYVFPMMLSPFTFTIRSPGQKRKRIDERAARVCALKNDLKSQSTWLLTEETTMEWLLPAQTHICVQIKGES